MSYTIDRVINADFDTVEARTRKALENHGFGVLTEIDVKATLKKKIGAEIDPYKILGACNPKMAHQALQLEPKVGAMLPCNVILRQTADGVMVSAIDPVASMQAIDNAKLKEVAGQVREMLSQAIAEV
jgi:uncharacterized protein (DUF302 family)